MSAVEVWRLFGGVLTTAGSALLVATAAWLARWKIQDLSRRQLLSLITDQKAYMEEKDRLLVAFREEMQRVQARCEESAKRMEDLDAQILDLVRQRHRRERWIRQVVTLCEAGGVTIPPWEE